MNVNHDGEPVWVKVTGRTNLPVPCIVLVPVEIESHQGIDDHAKRIKKKTLTSQFKKPNRTETMGQYFHPCILTVKDGIAVIVAWLSAHRFGNGLKQMEHAYLDNNFVGAFEWLISPEGPHHKAPVVWAGDYGSIENGYKDTTLYALCSEETHANPQGDGAAFPLVVNHTKRVFVDKRNVKGNIHPLPLLTMETAGGGGGDYRGLNEQFLGIWARDVISVEKTVPEGYEEVSFEFEEC